MEWLFKNPIAHRGLHDDKLPENSMPAFAAAIEKGYNIEIDVHITLDGKVVVFHDGNLKRVCQIEHDIKLENLTYDELLKYTLLGTEHKIPLLSEFLELVDGKVGLLIELKNMNPLSNKLEIAVIEILKNYKGEFALQSFNPWSMKYCRKHSDFVVGQLATFGTIGLLGKLRLLGVSRPAFIAYDIRQAENKYVSKWKQKLPLLVWTIDSPEKLQKAKDIGANNIIFEHIEPNFK